MPIPTDIDHELAQTAKRLEQERARARKAQAKERAEDRAGVAGEALARARALEPAERIFAWLATDGRALADKLDRAGIPELGLISIDGGRRGTLWLKADGALFLERRFSVFGGDRGPVANPSDLAGRFPAEAITELADLITGGKIWDRVRGALGGLRRHARRVAEQEELDALIAETAPDED